MFLFFILLISLFILPTSSTITFFDKWVFEINGYFNVNENNPFEYFIFIGTIKEYVKVQKQIRDYYEDDDIL